MGPRVEIEFRFTFVLVVFTIIISVMTPRAIDCHVDGLENDLISDQ